jgi:cell division septal protein FtsQ
MWLGRSERNRRHERSSVLGVRRRAEPLRRGRRRLVLAAFCVAVLALGTAMAGRQVLGWARQQILDTGLFALTTIEVSTDGNWVTTEEVRRWAGVSEGANLLTVDLARIRRDLELVPQIQSASVERVLPHLLRLRVAEREPLARVQGLALEDSGGFAPTTYYLDAEAVVMPALPGGGASPAFQQSLETLPVVRGLAQRELCPGQRIVSPSAQTALRVLANLEQSAMAGQTEVKTIDVSLPDVLVLTTVDGASVTLALDRLEQQLQRWRWVRDAGLRLAKAVAHLDLSLTNNCPVIWVEATNLPPAKPRTVNPPRGGKRHV